ncbi:hypothetical protein [Cyanobium gracile]|uniref:hypothetical protein n=1 Tax=Cyanobium gracile TaxID=59930 RepID=UPI0002E2810A|nr:hypothetical protein [Cyanobium gracile]
MIVHALAATVWTGGHLVLDLGVLPRARLRLIPNLSDANLSGLAWHICAITALAIAFVVVGALIRLGGVLG